MAGHGANCLSERFLVTPSTVLSHVEHRADAPSARYSGQLSTVLVFPASLHPVKPMNKAMQKKGERGEGGKVHLNKRYFR